MNKKQNEFLEKCERVGICDKVPPLDEIFILPTNKRHDSGYKIMNIVGYEYKTKKYYLLDTWCDVVNLGGYFSKEDISNINIDIAENGIIRLWNDKQRFISWSRVSSCGFLFVSKEANND